MIKTKVPGKLYIAGEYSVIETGYPAVLVAVDRFVNFSISASAKDTGTIFSKQYQTAPVKWNRQQGSIQLLEPSSSLNFVLTAIKITEKYLAENNVKLRYFDLTIDSQLDSTDGKKYGLGSSAAVTVGTIKALCKFYRFNIDKLSLFKLASLSHYLVQGNGSLGDIAAITYGGWIGYHSVDRNWLMKQSLTSITNIIDQKWPKLKIQQLKAPSNLNLLVGWTGVPATTANLIHQFENNKTDDYLNFLNNSRICVEQLISAFIDDDMFEIKQKIEDNRQLLLKLSSLTDFNIETPKLTKLIEIAHKYNGVAKTSGAGGGDCGIAIFDNQNYLTKVIDEWKQNNIISLSLHAYQED